MPQVLQVLQVLQVVGGYLCAVSKHQLRLV
jgi:hypothetical protein